MLCSNCGENEANIMYTQIINGVKKELILCEKCAKKIGVDNINFNMSINFSDFLTDFFENDEEFKFLKNVNVNKCDECGLTYDEFVKTGKFGCANCFDVFDSKIDYIAKNLHGASRHVGRMSKHMQEKVKLEKGKEKENVKEDKKNLLNKDLKKAIKEERYEDAAKIRDELKGLGE